MKVVLLCGGMGTRMRDYHELLPKPLVPIGGRPIAWHIMKYYAQFGHKEFVLCLGYKREAFVDYFINYRYRNADMTVDLRQGEEPNIEFHSAGPPAEDWRVTLADTGLLTSTGSRLKRVAKYLDDGPFLLTYGDGLSNVDIDALIEHHRQHGKLATVLAVHPSGRFGEIELDGAEVIRFAEKPQTTDGYINGGFMVLEREFIGRYIIDDHDCVLESDALTRCARDNELVAFRHDGFWQCMDTSREQQMLDSMWQSGDAPWRVCESEAIQLYRHAS